MLVKILIVLALFIVVFVVIVVRQPSGFRVARATTISAPASVVFAKVNDLHTWQEFSPWAKMDPAARVTFDGPPSGAGASFAWAGNRQVGEGRMTITESRPHELIRFRLDFVKPFKATQAAEFAFKPEGGRTAVTWSMSGENSFLFKAAGLFMDCEQMIGAQFEQGLAHLKALAESEPKP
ncbi:MAG TPA: SRPBCC family protein [Rariglobus sp.]